MGKALIIAEKPSVASDISKALGKFQKQDDYFENDDYVISSAVGHLLTIVPPEGVEAARGKWTFKCLPVIPPHFDLEPIEKTEKRLNALKKLIKRPDDDGVQLEARRLFQNHRGPRADADVGDSRGARAEDQKVRPAGFLGNHRHVRRGGGAIHGALV